MKLRLKERIAWYNTIAVALTIAVVSVVIYLVVYSTSFRQLDDGIRAECGEALSNLDWKGDSIIIYQMTEWEEAEHSQIELNPVFLQVEDLRGRVVFRTVNLVHDVLQARASGSEEFFYSGMIRAEHVRQGQYPVRNELGKKIGILIVGVSADSTYRILRNLRLALMIAFPVVLIVIFFVTTLAASRGISPVNDLIASTSGIDDSTLNTRLQLPGTRDEVFMLATTINELLDRVENSIHQQKQFTADASHELRTPLSAIRGTLEVLIRNQHVPEYYEGKISEVIYQVDRLNNLISQLLQLTRLDSGTVPMKAEHISLHQFIQDLAEKWKASLNDRDMHLIMEIPRDVKITGDPVFLEHILDNLVNNAIKYGNPAGHIIMTWNQEKRCLSVKDDGPGIPSRYLPHLFDRFFRTDSSRNSKVDGNGLGLSIVRKLADLQKILISVKSEEGKGTEFQLVFSQ